MKKTSSTGKSANALPSFLGKQTTDAADQGEPVAIDPDHDADDASESGYEDEEHDYDDAAEGADDGDYDAYAEQDDYADDEAEDEPRDDLDEDLDAPAPRRSTRGRSSSRRRSRTPAPRPEGGLALGGGMLLTIAGLVAPFVPAAAVALGAAGISAQLVVLLGVALVGIGSAQRRHGRIEQQLEQAERSRSDERESMLDSIEDLLQHLVANGGIKADDEHAAGGVQQVLLSLQRQDQKVNNLTKAIKMYGKPLMEIANQSSDIAGRLSKVRGLIESGQETNRQALQRVGEAIQKSSKQTDLGDLPEKIGKVEVHVAAMAQRLEDTEVRKSLVRLEETSKGLQQLVGDSSQRIEQRVDSSSKELQERVDTSSKELQERLDASSKDLQTRLEHVQRGDTVREATSSLQQRLDQATAGLEKGIVELREGNLGGLEAAVKEIQREMHGLATGLAQVQAAVKSGARTAAPVAAAATAPAPAATAPSTPSPATTSAPSSPSAGSADANDDSGGYATGKRTTAGKNVLGAIAKLKQMKG